MSKKHQILLEIAQRLLELTIQAYLNLPYEGFQRAFDDIMEIWVIITHEQETDNVEKEI